MSNTEPLLLKPNKAASVLAISPRKLWELTNRKAIPHLRIGRSVRYDLADLKGWIAEMKENAAS
jgi:excisionase family DNA binding protein